ncbi:hypothetical protein H2O64_03665 [Kordia sp. YSTF-M3]|uniref:Uncharacterized protein n=1 Tax=Kordia aestuariivivens TaxID=2759037 RepID=A0ABR7Q5B8_9FLAO|nr:hypothetical protein [Kordia aestuariivivens]MBC8753752.1 hypothetical protein [Kordia aestuariivivens]
MNKKSISSLSGMHKIIGGSDSCGVCPNIDDSLNAACTATGDQCDFSLNWNDNCPNGSGIISCLPSNESPDTVVHYPQ